MLSALLAGTVWALSVSQAFAGVQFGGVNIAGFDFGCDISGKCDVSKVVAPLHQYKGQDGAAQMEHFVKDDKLNAFRLPVAWQFLVENPGSPLISANMEQYDALVQACLATGSLCIIDIHNYARWDGLIIGQGGPKDEQFADLWSQLATKYAKSPKVAFGIVNEPHEVPDIKRWAQTCQTVVDAIRKAGATEHFIMLPGNGYTSAGSFVSSGSAAALATVKDSDGSTDKLIFEVHKYLDSDNSGTATECVSDDINAFEDLTKWLNDNKRQAFLAETGGGSSSSSCLKDVCSLLSYLNDNSGVYMGYLGWAAGSFDATYKLALTPTGNQDVPLMTQCFAKLFSGSGASPPPSGPATTGGSGVLPPASSSGGNLPPVPSQSFPSAPYPTGGSSSGPTGTGGTGAGATGTGGMPMPTGGLPGGQGGYRPTTFATVTTPSSAAAGLPSGSAANLSNSGNNVGQGGAAEWGSKGSKHVVGKQPADDECVNDGKE